MSIGVYMFAYLAAAGLTIGFALLVYQLFCLAEKYNNDEDDDDDNQ